MFFYNKLYIKKKINKKQNNFLLNNFLTWHKKNLIWQFFYSGFYFDDIFSKIIKIMFNKMFNISTFFFFDKWFSYWTGAGLFKQGLNIFNKLFYFEKINYFFYLYILIISIPFSFIFFYFIFILYI